MVSSVAFVSWVVNSWRRCSSQSSLRIFCSFILDSFPRYRFDSFSLLWLPAVQQNEFLNSLSRVHLSGIQTPLGIRRDLVDPVKLPRVAALVPGLAQHGAILPPQRPDDAVLAVGQQQKLLLFIDRKRKLPHRAHAQCFRSHSELFHEFSRLRTHL